MGTIVPENTPNSPASLITNEGQARELGKVPEEDRVQVLEQAAVATTIKCALCALEYIRNREDKMSSRSTRLEN